MSKYKYAIISGYFNPIHAGHIDYIESARSMCDHLIAIVNNDYQAVKKIGKIFIPEQDRLKIVKSIKYIDTAILAVDKESDISNTLLVIFKYLRSLNNTGNVAFINSGDRQTGNVDEIKICHSFNVDTVYIQMEKVDSSTRIRSLIE